MTEQLQQALSCVEVQQQCEIGRSCEVAVRPSVQNNPKNNAVKNSPSQPVLRNTPSLIIGRLEVISRSLLFLSRL